jgi:hypothetical protein
MFMTVAVFATGMLFAPARKSPDPTQQVSSTKPADQSDQAKNPDADLAGSTWLTKDAAGFFTFILVCVGGIQAWFFRVQLRLIRTSLVDAKVTADAAKRAAKATEDAVELSRTTAQLQLRAYIVVDISDIDMRGPENARLVKFGITVKNTGQTPAHDLNIVSRADLLEYPIKVPFDFTLISGADPSFAVLGAGQSTDSESVVERPFNGDEMMRAESPEGGFASIRGAASLIVMFLVVLTTPTFALASSLLITKRSRTPASTITTQAKTRTAPDCLNQRRGFGLFLSSPGTSPSWEHRAPRCASKDEAIEVEGALKPSG